MKRAFIPEAPRRFGTIACGLAIMLSCAPASAKTVTVTQTAPACTSWAGWHEWSLASLTPKGARLNKNCPLSIDKGETVEIIDPDAGEGAVTVRWRGKIWFVDDNRLSD
jgi:hypothetical protein